MSVIPWGRSLDRHRGRGRVERLLAHLPARRDRGPVASVLCYHSVDPRGGPHTSATLDELARQLDWLAANAAVVPLDAIDRRLRTPDGDRPVVALTFDDGYEDNHRHALPALADRGLAATFFVSSGFIDDVEGVRAHLAGAWAEPPPEVRAMSWTQIHELADAGMEIGGHTRTHRDLAALPAADAENDIGDDRRRLEDRFGRAVTSFAYPFGRPGHNLTPATVDLVRRAGYDRAVTVSFRRVGPGTSPWAMPRIPIRHDDADLIEAKLAGRLDLLGRLQDGRVPAPPSPQAV